jgi:aryl-alcohol dehydrogenase-like predicted oxidoreductase
MPEPAFPLIPLGGSTIWVSPMGVGTNAWGKGGRPRPDIAPVYRAALDAGIDLIDTAEIYGGGGSERTIAACIRDLGPAGKRPVILSKFFPFPWRLGRPAFLRALRKSLDRLGLPSVDVYLIHFPWGPIDTFLEALADAVESGLVRAAGVSNFGAERTRRAHEALSRCGITLACNEIEYSLLRRGAERNGTLAACRDLGITPIAYRPLGLGLLAAAAGQPTGWRRLAAKNMQGDATDALVRLLGEIGQAHGGKTSPQVALNWVMRKGALPIPGATSVPHLRDNLGALGWALGDSEVAALDVASAPG